MNPRPKTLAIVGADAEASRNAIEGALANAKAAGLEIVYNRSYPPTTNDFSPIVRAIQAARCGGGLCRVLSVRTASAW